MSTNSNMATRFTGWIAIVGGILAYANVTLVSMATGGDNDVVLHGATMLSLSATAHELFRWSMVADILGFYLPVLVIGGYLWNRFRDQAGAMGDMAAMAITLYAVVGIAGAAMQLAALNPLVQLHAGGDATSKAAAEVTWTAIARACQDGLWWSEGPVVLFWGLIVGRQLTKAGIGGVPLFLLKVVGWCFGLLFVSGMFQSLNAFMEALVIVVVLLFPMWMLLFGGQLLRRSRLHATPDIHGLRTRGKQ